VILAVTSLCSLLIYQLSKASFDFAHENFFFFLLPPILFAAGYTMKKRRFFLNFPYITFYGIFGTIVNFMVVLLLTNYVNENWGFPLSWACSEGQEGEVKRLTPFELLMLAATASSTDTVAALTYIKPHEYPKVYSIVFGEGNEHFSKIFNFIPSRYCK